MKNKRKSYDFLFFIYRKKGVKLMRIAVDGMGGDHSPSAVVEGCVQALEEFKDI